MKNIIDTNSAKNPVIGKIRKLIKIKKLFLFLLLFLVSPWSRANVNGDLTTFFNGLGMTTNSTAPYAYKGQQAGFYSGGSLFARSAVRTVNLVTVDLPGFRAGCGGIDMFAGGFSFVNSDELIKTMRDVMNSAKGYAMLLALEEVTPQIANGVKFMQDMANEINQRNINSCETAEGLVDGAWHKIRASQQQVCQDVGNSRGLFYDWAESREGCTRDGLLYNFDSAMKVGSTNAQYKNLILDQGNVAWKALQANNLVKGDQQLAELLMSLSGSIIITKMGEGKDATMQFKNLASLATNASLLKAILYGENATFYQCDEAEFCLNPTTQTIAISSNSALTMQVKKMLISMSQKITSDQVLSAEEIGLLQSTGIPIYKILAVQAAFQKGSHSFNVENYSDIIAADILFQYLKENLNFVKASSAVLQYPEDIIKRFNDGISQALMDVRSEEQKAQVKVSASIQLIEQTQVIEKMLAGQLSVQLGNSLTWVRSLR